MPSSDERRKAMRDMAKEEIRGEQAKYKVDKYVTTGVDSGEGAFPSVTALEVYKAVIDKGSGPGFVEIAGGERGPFWVRTSPEGTGLEVIKLEAGEMCMIHGCSTVLYIRPR